MNTQQNSAGTRRSTSIAVIGIGCRYPGASGPRELWENVLSRRQQFRKIPDCRLPLDQYHDPDPDAPDTTYGRRAGVIDGFEFDWVKWRMPKATCEATDIVQWLALEVAAAAIEDAGFDRKTVPRERTGVVLGNTLTGEHTRANTMRTRWPYVRRALLAAAAARGFSGKQAGELAAAMEPIFKSVFPPVTEDTLAGGLSNTIAGRVCNAFDFGGGGYVIDGACSSSLLAVCQAADALTAGDLDLALAGGVDISLDTFELIGFAKTGALTPDEMRVYDRRGNGFIPGEGCGFVVLKRLEDAERDGDFIYAVVQGWGISSDGKGGLTAPAVSGQAHALHRAYEKAGYPAAEVDFIEGHGTGTRVGDKVELEAIADVVGEAAPRTVGVTSFKSIVGHTKAAAGIGAFIKTAIALNRRVIPPTAGCSQPHDVFRTTAKSLYPILSGQVGDPTRTLRAGVSAMGFGGINSHVTLESGMPPGDRLAPGLEERTLLASNRDSELFVVDAASLEELTRKLNELVDTAGPLSQAELIDLAAELWGQLTSSGCRAAVVASSPDELATRLEEMTSTLTSEDFASERRETLSDPGGNWWIGTGTGHRRTAWLFPGQGSQQLQMARALIERHAWARDLAHCADGWLGEMGLPPVTPLIDRCPELAADDDDLKRWKEELARTDIAQPAICLASLLHDRHLERLGMRPDIVLGHSLGELTAMCVAGVFDEKTLIQLAGLRGQLMAESSDIPGSMLSLTCDAETAAPLIADLPGRAVVANRNSRIQTIISGECSAVNQVLQRAEVAGIAAIPLPVSGAFHSPLMQSAADELRTRAEIPEVVGTTEIPVISSMTGALLNPETNLREYLAAQMVSPVDFLCAAQTLLAHAPDAVEVGPGRILSRLLNGETAEDMICLPVAARAGSDIDLHRVLGRAFAAGVSLKGEELFADRLVRPFVPPQQRRFIDNPCERPFRMDHAESPIEVPAEVAPAGLLNSTGLAADELNGYLARRGKFLAEVIRADVASLNGTLRELPELPLTLPGPSHAEPADSQSGSPDDAGRGIAADSQAPHHASISAADLESQVLEIASRRTGFPVGGLSLENRLLDDLNLDSIKAAELVAEAAKAAGVAGQLDPSQFANASLGEVAAALVQTGGAASAEPSTTPAAAAVRTSHASGDESLWVRNFVIEYVELSA